MLTATQPFFRPSPPLLPFIDAALLLQQGCNPFEGAPFRVEFRAQAKQATQLSVAWQGGCILVTQYRRGN